MRNAKKILAILLSLLLMFTTVSNSVVAVSDYVAVEKVQIESVGNIYGVVFIAQKLIDIVHDFFGNIFAMFNSECIFCGKLHGEEIEEKKYTVSFNLNYDGAEESLPQIVKEGGLAIKPENPTRNGYVFVCWYEDASCTLEADLNEPIYEDKIYYAGWIFVHKIDLTASKSVLVQAYEQETLYFYAESTQKVDFISLYSADDEYIVDMKDDGKYGESGDDLQGDGIFSCKVDIDKTDELEYSYYAASGTLVSDYITVKVCAPLSEEELEDFEKTDLKIQNDIFMAEGYSEMSIEERKDLSELVLADLIDSDLIIEESIVYNEESATYTFLYTSNVIGTVSLKEWSDEQNGATERKRVAEANVTNEPVIVTSAASTVSTNIGEAIILWSFNQAWDDPTYRQPFYTNLASEWDEKGLDTTVDWTATVEDYKNLGEYEVIIFSGHGTYAAYDHGGSDVVLPSLILTEASNKDNDDFYSEDLTQFRIARSHVQGGTKYAILPKFFTDYYGSDGLDGAFVYAENCEFRGSQGVYSSVMSSAIIGASAESVIGFHNSVMADYSRDLMKAYVDALIEGETTSEAFTTAREEYGYDDNFYMREYLYGPIATPYIASNNPYATLIPVGIQNGDFEESSSPTGWNTVGDTKVISKLGSLTPQSGSKMAVISTGIGSGESIYLEGTEGSILEQKFRITNNHSQLYFTYDVISEEPMEYVGSGYDDTFVVELIDEHGNVIVLPAKETVNTSTWYSISGIDFDGGDSTAYHTGWQVATYDLSDYIGETVIIRFKVYDKGDSIYDTAVIIDSVTSSYEGGVSGGGSGGGNSGSW